MKKLTVEYRPNDNLIEKVADGCAEKYVMDYIISIKESNENVHFVFLTSQEMVIEYFRVAILRGLISHEDIEFRFMDKVILSNKYGYLDWWPAGFCDYIDRILEELLRETLDKYNEENNDTGQEKNST